MLLPKMPKAENTTQPVFTCSKLTIETLEQGVKYVTRTTPDRREWLVFLLLTLNM